MTSSIASAAVLPKPPSRARAIGIMAVLGVVTGLISSLPSPLPDLRLGEPDILLNARGVPLHAGIAFGAMLAAMLWLWASRDLGKCLLAMALTMGFALGLTRKRPKTDRLVISEKEVRPRRPARVRGHPA